MWLFLSPIFFYVTVTTTTTTTATSTFTASNNDLEERLEILAEFLSSVIFGDFYLEGGVLANEGGEARETLAPAAADPDEQHVAARLADAADDAGHVLRRVPEQHQIHRHVADRRVVRFQQIHHVPCYSPPLWR